MNVRITLFYILLHLLLLSCSEGNKEVASVLKYEKTTLDSDNYEEEFLKWWTYYKNNILLSTDFIALDTSYTQIPKEAFLGFLKSGRFIPIKLVSKDEFTYLKLHALTDNADQSISTTIKNEAIVLHEQYKMEGVQIPDFDFKTIDGKTYNSLNTKGKYLILKCWFIACKACVEEFPELNELVDSYQDRNDIVFISLAYNKETALKKFLGKREFNYETAAVDRTFLQEELKVNQYPTHFIVDKNGNIKKMVNSFKELELSIRKEVK